MFKTRYFPTICGAQFFIYNLYTDVDFQRLAFEGYKPVRHNNNIFNKLQTTPWANGITEFKANHRATVFSLSGLVLTRSTEIWPLYRGILLMIFVLYFPKGFASFMSIKKI